LREQFARGAGRTGAHPAEVLSMTPMRLPST
jgi:hypothetical protein